MDFSTYFPEIIGSFNSSPTRTISQTTFRRSVSKGTILHNGSVSCLGMLLMTPDSFGHISYLTKEEKSPSIVFF